MRQDYDPDERFDEGEADDLGDRDDEGEELADEAEVTCPYCGETTAIALDPGGGAVQEYIEDCQVCCRPWQVHVEYDDAGVAQVSVTETG